MAERARAVAFCALILAALTLSPPAFAHANLASSDPAAGSRVDSAPRFVTLSFTEEPELSLSTIEVLSSSGGRADSGAVSVAGARALRVPVGALSRGTYTVAWHVISKVDGHATAGSFAFGFGVAPSPASAKPPVGPASDPIEMVGRFLFIAGLVVCFGGSIVSLRGVRVVRGYIASGSLLALAGVVVLALAQQATADASWSALLKTTVGRALLWRAWAVAFALGASFVSVAATALFAAAAMVVEVRAGHAAGTSSAALQIAAQTLHFAAAAVWIGGLGALLLGIRGEHSRERAEAVRRYATLAALSLAIVAATGTYRAIGQIGSWDGLLHSSYGTVVIVKIALLIVLAGLGARQRFFNLRRLDIELHGLRKIGTAEVSVAIAVFAATAILTGLSPPPPASASAGAVVAEGSDPGRVAKARLEVIPGRPGANRFVVRIKSDTMPETVTLRFAYKSAGDIGPSTLVLHRKGDAWQANGTNVSLEGRWSITVVVQGRDTGAEVPLEVATPCDTQAVPGGKGPTVYTKDSAVGSVQMYVDPGRSGYNEVHFTYFDRRGEELGVKDTPRITAWRPGRARTLSVRRFSDGHFIASGRLTHGSWRFESNSKALFACFEQEIG